jgi:hypothetical protein
MWKRQQLEINAHMQERVLACYDPKHPEHEVWKQVSRRAARDLAEMLRSLPPLPQSDEAYEEMRREQWSIFERQQLRGASSSSQDGETQPKKDNLTRLVMDQFLGVLHYNRDNLLLETHTRIHQITEAINRHPTIARTIMNNPGDANRETLFRFLEPIYTALHRLSPFSRTINLGDAADREALFRYLEPIYTAFHRHMREHTPYVFHLDDRSCYPYTAEYTLLHEHLMRHGFSVETTEKYIKNEMMKEGRQPVLSISYLHSTAELKKMVAEMDPTSTVFQPLRKSVHQQICEARILPLAMSQHKRLGESCLMAWLNVDLLRKIAANLHHHSV